MFYQLLISHFLFDYASALTPKMLEAKSKGYPIFPIFQHALLHTLGVLIILLINSTNWEIILAACFLELVSHTIIDTTKGRIENKYPIFKENNRWHWHLFQIDQFLHVTVMYIISLM